MSRTPLTTTTLTREFVSLLLRGGAKTGAGNGELASAVVHLPSAELAALTLDEFSKKWLVPMVENVLKEGRTFSPDGPELPRGVIGTVESHAGVAVRGVECWPIADPGMLLRFDLRRAA